MKMKKIWVIWMMTLWVSVSLLVWLDVSAGDSSRIRGVRVEQTRFRVQKNDGSWASHQELIGAMLVASDDRGIKETYRIDSIEPYSSPETGEIFFYTFSVRDPQTGNWVNFCMPDRQGRRQGFPISGYWDAQGNHVRSENEYSITCTSGTIGKCVLMGYLPWEQTKNGVSLWEYHQACVRMMRADYCGNGKSHTRSGTLVEIYDREEIQVDTSVPGLTFEAAWNEDGAVCLRKTRIPEDYTLDDILKECPEKLTNHAGETHCSESFENPHVLILNRSGD